jgi:hypothetical protein
MRSLARGIGVSSLKKITLKANQKRTGSKWEEGVSGNASLD